MFLLFTYLFLFSTSITNIGTQSGNLFLSDSRETIFPIGRRTYIEKIIDTKAILAATTVRTDG